MDRDERYMRRCLELASKAEGNTCPNPMVGCVIVHNGKVIGKGYHKKAGLPHAEVNALRSVKNRKMLADSVLYVNLEPCSHHGKTPPCADLIIASGIRKVVIGMKDPNPKVNGKGINRLRRSGVHVKTGVLNQECLDLNRRFVSIHKMGRPWVILKWAQSKNGIIGVHGKKLKISSTASHRLSHKWRSLESAILIGRVTAENDNPALTTRLVKGNDPVRVVIDPERKLPNRLKIFKSKGKVIVVGHRPKSGSQNYTYIYVKPGSGFIPGMLRNLVGLGIQSVLVEGGAVTLDRFIKSGQWDEARVFISNKELTLSSNSVKAPKIRMKKVKVIKSGSDRLRQGRRI